MDLIVTLKTENNENNVYPNIVYSNIPDSIIDIQKINPSYTNYLRTLFTNPTYKTATSTEITGLSSNNGLYVATDTGHWYYWDGTHYTDGGVFNSMVIGNNVVTKENTTFAYNIKSGNYKANMFDIYKKSARLSGNIIGQQLKTIPAELTYESRCIFRLSLKNVKTIRINAPNDLPDAGIECFDFVRENGTVYAIGLNNNFGIDYTVNEGSVKDTDYVYIQWWEKGTKDFNCTISITFNENVQLNNEDTKYISKENKLTDIVKVNYFKDKYAMFFGDSIVQGYTSGSTTTTENFVKIFSELAELKEYDNFGVASSTFSVVASRPQIITKLSDTDITVTDFIFIAGGINDYASQVSESDLQAGLEQICEYLKDNITSNQKVFFILPINTINDYGNEITLELVRNYINYYCLKYGFYCINGKNFGFPDTASELSTILFGDGIHPTENGYVLYAHSLYQELIGFQG